MIVKWPEHVFARLLPMGLQDGSFRYADARPPAVRRAVSDNNDAPAAFQHDNLTKVSSPVEEEFKLSPTVSFSEDEDGNDSSTVRVRRVRFDEAVQVTAISPKAAAKKYPKTPPRRKTNDDHNISSTEEEPSAKTESTFGSSSSSSSKKRTTSTPRRLSLRSASKAAPDKKAVTFTEAKKEKEEPIESKETTPVQEEKVEAVETAVKEPKATPRRTPRRKSTSSATPRRTSLRSASKAAKKEEEGINADDESSNTKTSRSRSPSTPSRSTRRQSPSSSNKAATKADNLKALSLLGKLPKQAKRDLLAPLQRAKDCHNNHDELSENLLLLVVDYKSAGALLQFLSEKPAMLDTVLQQLRSYEG